MKIEELVKHARRLATKCLNSPEAHTYQLARRAEGLEFLRQFAGPNSAFTIEANSLDNGLCDHVGEILNSFADYLEAGLHADVSPERQAQLDVVSDFLAQAEELLNDNQVHPAAAAVLAGATLEEFLRTWVEKEKLTITGKPGMEAYSTALRQANFLDKQDGKDITSWAGTRNDAAHGNWEAVKDRERVKLMLAGVNLFLRKYQKGKPTS